MSSGIPAKATKERREGIDRRNNHFKALFYQFIKPRRRDKARRATDPHTFHVDFHDPILLVVVLVIVSLCIVDLYATLALLQQGGIELNPFMRHLIHTDLWLFFWFKYSVTVAGLFVLLSCRRYRLYSKFNTLHALYAVLVIYVLLAAYQFELLALAAG